MHGLPKTDSGSIPGSVLTQRGVEHWSLTKVIQTLKFSTELIDEVTGIAQGPKYYEWDGEIFFELVEFWNFVDVVN